MSPIYYQFLTLIHPRTGVVFRVGLIRISGSTKKPRLYVANTLLYSSHDNISDCSIRVSIYCCYNYGSPGRRPTVYTYYKTAYFNHVDISASFKKFPKNYTYLLS